MRNNRFATVGMDIYIIVLLVSLFLISVNNKVYASTVNILSTESLDNANIQGSMGVGSIIGDSQPVTSQKMQNDTAALYNNNSVLLAEASSDSDNTNSSSTANNTEQDVSSDKAAASSEPVEPQGYSASASSQTPGTPSIEIVPLGNTGASSTSFPITVPPGRKNIAPNLSLNYSSSRRANGWLGLGWDMDMGDIRKSGKKDVDYVFVLNGSPVELVSRGDWGTECYGAKIVGSFSKHCYITAQDKWEVTTRDGTKYYYGSSAASRQDDDNGTFRWRLDEVIDLNGNYMKVYYDEDQGEIYLDRIEYTGNGSLTPSNYVQFTREARTDVYTMYNIGSQVVTAERLKQIDVFANGQLARSYVLNYTYSPHSSRSMLSSMTTYGSDGVSALPAVTFTYETSNDLFQMYKSISIASGDSPKTVGDFNGDAKMDFITCNGDGYYSSETNHYLAFANWAGFQCATHANIAGDFNGDGRDDMLVFDIGSQYPDVDLFLSVDSPAFFEYESTTFPGERPVASGDFNGDGKSDFVSVTGKIFYSYLDNNVYKFGYAGNEGLFGTNSAFAGDFNSNTDGKDEVLLDNQSGTAYLYISKGNDFQEVASITATPVAAGDFNGDGMTDLIDSGSNIHFSGGMGFNSPVAAQGLPESLTDIIGGDFDGDGKSDVMIRNGNSVEIYAATGPVTDLLVKTENGYGAETTVSYKPSTEYNNIFLPFVVQTVSSTTVSDGVGNLSMTTYDYADGNYIYEDLEFRGFRHVETTAPNGAVTETWYKQDDIFKGLVEEQIASDSEGNLYSRSVNTYLSTAPYTGVVFPYLNTKDDYIYDGTTTAKQARIDFEYDTYGNIKRKYFYGDVSISGDEKDEYTIYEPFDTTNWLLSIPKNKYLKDGSGVTKAESWFTYSTEGNLETKTEWNNDGVNPVTSFTYDSYGNVETITDPNQNQAMAFLHLVVMSMLACLQTLLLLEVEAAEGVAPGA